MMELIYLIMGLICIAYAFASVIWTNKDKNRFNQFEKENNLFKKNVRRFVNNDRT